MDIYYNSLKKYKDCMKSIDEAFLSTLLKHSIQDWRMLNIKYKNKMNALKNIEMIQYITKSKKTKKSKRPRDEEYIKKMKGRKQHPPP